MRVQPVNTLDAQKAPYGPCLFLGPRGERCSRQAAENGYCVNHDPEGPPIITGVPGKRFWALVGATAVLWPFLVDIVRIILRWLR
ncbi:MAG: DUF5763 domain-containing protein [Candidatus Acidiferrales bacterium]